MFLAISIVLVIVLVVVVRRARLLRKELDRAVGHVTDLALEREDLNHKVRVLEGEAKDLGGEVLSLQWYKDLVGAIPNEVLKPYEDKLIHGEDEDDHYEDDDNDYVGSWDDEYEEEEESSYSTGYSHPRGCDCGDCEAGYGRDLAIRQAMETGEGWENF